MALMADRKAYDAQNSNIRYPTSFIVVNTMERIKQIRKSMCVCGYVCVQIYMFVVLGWVLGVLNRMVGKILPRILYFKFCKHRILYLQHTKKFVFHAA